MGEIRDAARTRQRLIDAAVEEFSEKGFEGARVESVARRASASKQLVAHYFASKEALFREVLALNMREKEGEGAAPQDPARLFRQRFELALAERTWLRFVLWEAAEFAASGRIAEEEDRTTSLARQRESLLAFQRNGELDAAIDVEMLQLALFALSTYPIAFAQVTQMVTGLEPDSAVFRRRWSDFLAAMDQSMRGAAALAAAAGEVPRTTAPAAKRPRSRRA